MFKNRLLVLFFSLFFISILFLVSCIPKDTQKTLAGQAYTVGSCTDSDANTVEAGKNYNVRGTAKLGTTSKTDTCFIAADGKNKLKEYFCDTSGAIQSVEVLCSTVSSGRVCDTGACTVPSCSDGDSKNYQQRLTTRGLASTGDRFVLKTDSCALGADAGKVIEYFCASNLRDVQSELISCPSGQSCLNGACICPLISGSTTLRYTACGPRCVDTKISATDCGNCGVTCAAGQVCQNSLCVLLCGNGKVNTEVGETCDDGNLVNGDGCSGSCSVESGWSCAGEPSVCCSSEKTLCTLGAPVCADLQTDANNCGACGNICATGKICKESGCLEIYDDFSGSSVDTTKWEETAESNIGAQFVTEHSIVNGVYHTAQTTAVENRAVNLISKRLFKTGEIVEFDVILRDGSENWLSRIYFQGLGETMNVLSGRTFTSINDRFLDVRLIEEKYYLKGFPVSAAIGYWYGNSELGKMLGTYHVKIEFIATGAKTTITTPGGVSFPFKATFPMPARFGFSTQTKDSLASVDYDNVIVKGEPLPSGCTDSDGDNLQTQGTVTVINPDGTTIVRKDGCDSRGSWVNEVQCPNPLENHPVPCPTGTNVCSEGVCLIIYDEFKTSSLDLTKWEETAASDSGTEFVEEHGGTNGFYRTSQSTPANRAVTLISTRSFSDGETFEYDLTDYGGQGNHISRVYFDGSGENFPINERYLDTRLRAQGYDHKGFATSGDVGYWNGESEVGKIVGSGAHRTGEYHVKVEFANSGTNITITTYMTQPYPVTANFAGIFDALLTYPFQINLPLPARVGFSSKTGADSTIGVNYYYVLTKQK